MADKVRTYDPGAVNVVLFNIPISGFADGTFITIERDGEAFTKTVGAGGEVARVRNRNRAGKMTLTLMASSPCNDLLSAQADRDELDGSGVGTAFVKDSSGTDLATAAAAWIQKRPNVEKGKELGTREWVIDTGPLDLHVGSNN